VFLVLVWQRLEVCGSRRVSDRYVYAGRRYGRYPSRLWPKELAKEFARELARRKEIVTVRNLALASEVRLKSGVLALNVLSTRYTVLFRPSVQVTGDGGS
jgi:hypothetical protein